MKGIFRGKGDKDRTLDKDKYRKNYDKIDWGYNDKSRQKIKSKS